MLNSILTCRILEYHCSSASVMMFLAVAEDEGTASAFIQAFKTGASSRWCVSIGKISKHGVPMPDAYICMGLKFAGEMRRLNRLSLRPGVFDIFRAKKSNRWVVF